MWPARFGEIFYARRETYVMTNNALDSVKGVFFASLICIPFWFLIVWAILR